MKPSHRGDALGKKRSHNRSSAIENCVMDSQQGRPSDDSVNNPESSDGSDSTATSTSSKKRVVISRENEVRLYDPALPAASVGSPSSDEDSRSSSYGTLDGTKMQYSCSCSVCCEVRQQGGVTRGCDKVKLRTRARKAREQSLDSTAAYDCDDVADAGEIIQGEPPSSSALLPTTTMVTSSSSSSTSSSSSESGRRRDSENKKKPYPPSYAEAVQRIAPSGNNINDGADVDSVVNAIQAEVESSSTEANHLLERVRASDCDPASINAGHRKTVRGRGKNRTFHPAGQARVINIQTMADSVSGYLVMPGEWFSLNEVIGRRTTAKGYVPAGAIIGGWVQCCDNPANVGGGTSQFATTFYNAIFFSGLEDVPVSLRSRPPNIANSPHTLWFSKYPAGREATMGYPDNDVRFRNDTDTAVLIVTAHGPRATADRITVRMYGNTGGRTVEAVHSCRPPLWTIFPDVNAPEQRCRTSTTSQKVYQADASLSPGTSYTTPSQPGFRITVTRVIHWPDGHTTRVAFPWKYDPGPIIVETHPCNIPRGYAGYTGEACPSSGGGGSTGGGGAGST